VSLTSTHQVTDGMHSVIAKATKPESAPASVSVVPVPSVASISGELAVVPNGCGCGTGACC
jgi:hypothetical protein